MDESELLLELSEITADLYAALEDGRPARRWKKQAVSMLVILSGLQQELKEGANVPKKTLQKILRQARDLLKQLNRKERDEV